MEVNIDHGHGTFANVDNLIKASKKFSFSITAMITTLREVTHKLSPCDLQF